MSVNHVLYRRKKMARKPIKKTKRKTTIEFPQPIDINGANWNQPEDEYTQFIYEQNLYKFFVKINQFSDVKSESVNPISS